MRDVITGAEVYLEPVFLVEARSVIPDKRLHLPGGNRWVTVCRGRAHTLSEGEAAIQCFIRDFGFVADNLRLHGVQ